MIGPFILQYVFDLLIYPPDTRNHTPSLFRLDPQTLLR